MTLDLKEIIPYLCKGKSIKASQDIYQYLSPVDTALLQTQIDELNAIKSEKTQLKGTEKSQWQGDKSRRVGAKFEELINTLFKDSEVARVTLNLRGVVGEYDVSIALQPFKNCIPFLENHQQGLGEAKCHQDTISSDWVLELVGNLKMSNVSLGFIFVHTKPKKIPVPTKTALYGARAGGQAVLPFGAKQFAEVAQGKPLLVVLEDLHEQTTYVDSKLSI